MLKIKLMSLSIAGVMKRFYLMMALIIGGGFAGAWWLAFLGFPVFVSTVLGATFEWSIEPWYETKTLANSRMGYLMHK